MKRRAFFATLLAAPMAALLPKPVDWDSWANTPPQLDPQSAPIWYQDPYARYRSPEYKAAMARLIKDSPHFEFSRAPKLDEQRRFIEQFFWGKDGPPTV